MRTVEVPAHSGRAAGEEPEARLHWIELFRNDARVLFGRQGRNARGDALAGHQRGRAAVSLPAAKQRLSRRSVALINDPKTGPGSLILPPICS